MPVAAISAADPPAPDNSPAGALLSAIKARSEWKAFYDVSMGPGNSSHLKYMMEEAQYHKGNNSRTDTIRPLNGRKIEEDMSNGMQTRIYVLSGKAISCSQTLSETGWRCDEMNSPPSDLRQELQSKQAKYAISDDGMESVAGIDGACYKLAGDARTIRYCISPIGIPIYMKTSVLGMDIAMETTGYSANVADADFVLPVQPT